MKVLRKVRGSVVAAFVSLAWGGASLAIPYSNNSSGTSTVGPNVGDDYTTLSAACAAVTEGATRSAVGTWTFTITGDITETNDSVLRAFLNGSTITFKPQVGVTPTITYNVSTVTSGVGSHFAIGRQTSPSTINTKTENVVIDGSNILGGTTRDLTFQSTAGARQTIGVYGDTDGLTIKNIILNGRGMQITPIAGPLAPDNGVVQNCTINATISANSASMTSQVVATGWQFQDCDFTTATTGAVRLWTFGGFNNFTFLRCNMDFSASDDSGRMAIWWNGASQTGTWDSCKINVTESGSGNGSGAYFITLFQPSTINMYNNFLTVTGSSPSGQIGGGVGIVWLNNAVLGTVPDANVTGYNNSCILRTTSSMGAANSTMRFCILRLDAGAYAGTIDWRNNAMLNRFVTGAPSSAFYNFPADSGTININQNLAFVDSNTSPNARYGVWQGMTYANRATWNAASGQDANSSDAVNPLVRWTSQTDFHFSTPPSGSHPDWMSPALGGAVGDDIDGIGRASVTTTRGAVENPLIAPPTPTPAPPATITPGIPTSNLR